MLLPWLFSYPLLRQVCLIGLVSAAFLCFRHGGSRCFRRHTSFLTSSLPEGNSGVRTFVFLEIPRFKCFYRGCFLILCCGKSVSSALYLRHFCALDMVEAGAFVVTLHSSHPHYRKVTPVFGLLCSLKSLDSNAFIVVTSENRISAAGCRPLWRISRSFHRRQAGLTSACRIFPDTRP